MKAPRPRRSGLRVRTEHDLHVAQVHLRPHPHHPHRFVACECDLCRFIERLPVT